MRILLVEDQPQLLLTLQQALAEDGYSVDTARDGEDGLWKAESYDYDTVVLDVTLPGLDGWSVLGRLRARKSTPVLMLTARDSHRDRIRGLDLGADDYLVKPFDLGELLARIRALIRRSARHATDTIRSGAVRIDTRMRVVLLNERRVALTAREYAIVEYLFVHRGRVVSRDELRDHVLNEASEALSNAIDVHVSSIRRKLGANFVLTRRGLGYCIDDVVVQ